jgi:hypothetical protein
MKAIKGTFSLWGFPQDRHPGRFQSGVHPAWIPAFAGMTDPGRARYLLLLILALGVGGCTTVENFWRTEVVNVYAPRYSRDNDKARLVDSLNYFLGKSKDERVRVVGAPVQCVPLKQGWETCEWLPKVSGVEQQIGYTYNSEQIAVAWSYRGPLGQFTDANASTAIEAPQATSLSAPSRNAGNHGWVHASKGPETFLEEYFACQNALRNDSRAQQQPAENAEYAVRKCLREKGWVEK